MRAAPAPGGRRRRPTSTSAFGVSRRESHDASAFYARFSPPEILNGQALSPHRVRDRIWLGDARDMDANGEIADDSVALVVTSPPYFAGKEYEEALGEGHIPASYHQYLEMLHAVFGQCKAKLEPGGRIAVNVANLGRKPYRSLSADVIGILEDLGFLLRGEIIWKKQAAAGGSCAWGTYQRPGNPVLRDITERVVVASKGRFDRALSPEQRAAAGWPSEGSMFMDDFVDATTDLWDIPAESATRVGHPAPFPVELPRRLIELYTYRHDLVLDPFMGSGSTAVAAVRTERYFVGFDVDPGYIATAEQRVAEERERLAREQMDGGLARRVVVPAGRQNGGRGRSGRTASDATPEGDGPDRGDGGAFQARAVRQGQKASALALEALGQSGFRRIEQEPRYPDLGLDVNFRARDHEGRVWLFEVCGAFSSTRPGLKRTETIWKALGKASVLQEARRRDPRRRDLGPLVLLSTDVPARNSAGDRALRAVMPADGSGPVRDVIELLDPAGMARLATYGHGTPRSS